MGTVGIGWLSELAVAVAVGLLAFAAWSDIAARIIPDSVSIALALAGLVLRSLAGISGMAISVAAALILFALLLVLHARGVLGGGDVKLAAAVTVALPLAAVPGFLLVTSLAGGVLALLHLAARFALRGAPGVSPPPRGAYLLRRIVSAERWRIARHGSLPYGVAIACGGIWAVIYGPGG